MYGYKPLPLGRRGGWTEVVCSPKRILWANGRSGDSVLTSTTSGDPTVTHPDLPYA